MTSKIWTKDEIEVHSIFTVSSILRKLCDLDVRNVLPAHINIVSKYAYCLEKSIICQSPILCKK